MISYEEIEKEILTLEKKDTSYAVIERLAWLYIVKEHMEESSPEKRIERTKGSDFLIACDGKPIDTVLKIIDEYMQSVKEIYPKEYQYVVKLINDL